MTPAARLLEREAELAEVADAARVAASGHGCVVLVSGEAGIGKSSIVRAVLGLLPAEGRMLVGHCDDLSTARTLGPFRDLVGCVGAELAAALRDGADRDRLLAALRAELDGTARPTLLVIEDVHWADNATLDVLRFLVRRVAELPVVLLLTYRAGHPVSLQPEPGPYGLLIAGRWREAADFWRDAGARYEYALALAESADPPDLLAALEVFDALGATPSARRVRERLRRLGIMAVPRQGSTRRNPAGLTGRQLEVLQMIADGMTSTGIADRLVVSIRTVENHVSAVLAKLGVHTRAEAVARSKEFLRAR